MRTSTKLEFPQQHPGAEYLRARSVYDVNRTWLGTQTYPWRLRNLNTFTSLKATLLLLDDSSGPSHSSPLLLAIITSLVRLELDPNLWFQ